MHCNVTNDAIVGFENRRSKACVAYIKARYCCYKQYLQMEGEVDGMSCRQGTTHSTFYFNAIALGANNVRLPSRNYSWQSCGLCSLPGRCWTVVLLCRAFHMRVSICRCASTSFKITIFLVSSNAHPSNKSFLQHTTPCTPVCCLRRRSLGISNAHPIAHTCLATCDGNSLQHTPPCTPLCCHKCRSLGISNAHPT